MDFIRTEDKEAEKLTSDGKSEEKSGQKPQKASKPSTVGIMKKKKDKDKGVDEIISVVRNLSDESTDSEEADFWMPLVGEHRDFDDGGDRWCCSSESGQESDKVNGMGMFCLMLTQILFLCKLNRSLILLSIVIDSFVSIFFKW